MCLKCNNDDDHDDHDDDDDDDEAEKTASRELSNGNRDAFT